MYKKTSGGGSGGSGGASSGGSSGGGGGINKRPYDTAPHPGSSGYAGPGGGTDMKRSRPDQIGGGGMYASHSSGQNRIHPRSLPPPPPSNTGGIGSVGGSLPRRSGSEVCNTFKLIGMCKFGSSCRFDHPIEAHPSNAGVLGGRSLVQQQQALNQQQSRQLQQYGQKPSERFGQQPSQHYIQPQPTQPQVQAGQKSPPNHQHQQDYPYQHQQLYGQPQPPQQSSSSAPTPQGQLLQQQRYGVTPNTPGASSSASAAVALPAPAFNGTPYSSVYGSASIDATSPSGSTLAIPENASRGVGTALQQQQQPPNLSSYTPPGPTPTVVPGVQSSPPTSGAGDSYGGSTQQESATSPTDQTPSTTTTVATAPSTMGYGSQQQQPQVRNATVPSTSPCSASATTSPTTAVTPAAVIGCWVYDQNTGSYIMAPPPAAPGTSGASSITPSVAPAVSATDGSCSGSAAASILATTGTEVTGGTTASGYHHQQQGVAANAAQQQHQQSPYGGVHGSPQQPQPGRAYGQQPQSSVAAASSPGSAGGAYNNYVLQQQTATGRGGAITSASSSMGTPIAGVAPGGDISLNYGLQQLQQSGSSVPTNSVETPHVSPSHVYNPITRQYQAVYGGGMPPVSTTATTTASSAVVPDSNSSSSRAGAAVALTTEAAPTAGTDVGHDVTSSVTPPTASFALAASSQRYAQALQQQQPYGQQHVTYGPSPVQQQHCGKAVHTAATTGPAAATTLAGTQAPAPAVATSYGALQHSVQTTSMSSSATVIGYGGADSTFAYGTYSRELPAQQASASGQSIGSLQRTSSTNAAGNKAPTPLPNASTFKQDGPRSSSEAASSSSSSKTPAASKTSSNASKSRTLSKTSSALPSKASNVTPKSSSMAASQSRSGRAKSNQTTFTGTSKNDPLASAAAAYAAQQASAAAPAPAGVYATETVIGFGAVSGVYGTPASKGGGYGTVETAGFGEQQYGQRQPSTSIPVAQTYSSSVSAVSPYGTTPAQEQPPPHQHQIPPSAIGHCAVPQGPQQQQSAQQQQPVQQQQAPWQQQQQPNPGMQQLQPTQGMLPQQPSHQQQPGGAPVSGLLVGVSQPGQAGAVYPNNRPFGGVRGQQQSQHQQSISSSAPQQQQQQLSSLQQQKQQQQPSPVQQQQQPVFNPNINIRFGLPSGAQQQQGPPSGPSGLGVPGGPGGLGGPGTGLPNSGSFSCGGLPGRFLPNSINNIGPPTGSSGSLGLQQQRGMPLMSPPGMLGGGVPPNMPPSGLMGPGGPGGPASTLTGMQGAPGLGHTSQAHPVQGPSGQAFPGQGPPVGQGRGGAGGGHGAGYHPKYGIDHPTPNMPQRPSMPDCNFFVRTGVCRFQTDCKYNHPYHKVGVPSEYTENQPANPSDGSGGGFQLNSNSTGMAPNERAPCDVFLNTGVCTFGEKCRFRHITCGQLAIESAQGVSHPDPNQLPKRPGYPPCGFYARTGKCAFGMRCKFDHPTHINPSEGSHQATAGSLGATTARLMSPSENVRGGAATHTPPSSPQPSKSKVPTEVSARHILMKHKGSRRPSSWQDPTGAAIKQRTQDQATATLDSIRKGIKTQDQFSKVAMSKSDCSSAKRGGDLGTFGRGKMQRTFEDGAFDLRVGGISGVVSTDSGVHIIMRTS